MNKQSASTALEESPSSRAAASPHNELLMRFPLSGQLISISPDMRFQRTGIFKKAIKSKKTRNLGLRLPISGPVFTMSEYGRLKFQRFSKWLEKVRDNYEVAVLRGGAAAQWEKRLRCGAALRPNRKAAALTVQQLLYHFCV